ARHQSFTQAADELAVTQSAVCRQIAALEEFVGVKLFRRSKRGVLLTEAGQGYSLNVRARLDEVERDTLALMAKGGAAGGLELGVVPTFATRWLLPRMPAFQALHPGITVHMTPCTRPVLFADTPLDAALYAGDPHWPGTESRFLLDEQLVAVASPRLVAPRRTPRSAMEVARLPLLQQSTRPYMWRQWFDARGLKVEHDLAGPRMELFSMLTEAAIQGLGAALIPRLLIEQELADGRLFALTHGDFASDRCYSLIYPEAKSDNPALAAFRDWLEGEARRCRAA
ncbi:MAG TPA: LysR family transcriptional regulator, partial [Albitalea sp.]|nr:LysR family transcriptional regulator [Albitalea sp.]